MKNDPSRPTVLLFDVDGTLVDTGGAGRLAMERAFARAMNLPGEMEFSFGGMTDRAIVREALARNRSVASDAEIDRVIESYLELLAEELPKSARYRVLPGVEALLESLVGRSGYAVGLGTGNVRAGAALKLSRGGLETSFSFGGFGCDSEERSALLGVGARRGAEALGVTTRECRVVVIGDTLRDIQAARKIGAECVAVATGAAAYELLASGEPDALFRDLEADGVRTALLGENS